MIIISLGSNITSRWGNSPTTIHRALDELALRGIHVVKRSALYRTSPYGITNQPVFVNAAALVQTALPPAALLSVLKSIEVKAGREPTKRWGPRALDIDIIDYHARMINWPGGGRTHRRPGALPLILPHIEIQSRPFVLRPMLDIAPYWHHPISGKSVAEMLIKIRSHTGGDVLEIVPEHEVNDSLR
jgi:2-amino-4-hydroxy-6-hydroxymethyldihydropteridine diphosphokinase